MEYAKLQLVHTRAASWRLASVHARGAAVCVLGYCADQENGGRIPNASTLTNEDWKALACIRLIDVGRAVDSGLCKWDGRDLLCLLYDHHGEAALRVRRSQGERGREGGRPPKENPKGSQSDNPKGSELDNPTDNPQSIHPSPSIQSSPPIPPAGAVSAEDRWHYEHSQPWCTRLMQAVGNKVSRKTWPDWRRLCEEQGGGNADAGADRVATIAKTVPAKDRWSDAVEDALRAAGNQAPLSAAIARKIERIAL